MKNYAGFTTTTNHVQCTLHVWKNICSEHINESPINRITRDISPLNKNSIESMFVSAFFYLHAFHLHLVYCCMDTVVGNIAHRNYLNGWMNVINDNFRIKTIFQIGRFGFVYFGFDEKWRNWIGVKCMQYSVRNCGRLLYSEIFCVI